MRDWHLLASHCPVAQLASASDRLAGLMIACCLIAAMKRRTETPLRTSLHWREFSLPGAFSKSTDGLHPSPATQELWRQMLWRLTPSRPRRQSVYGLIKSYTRHSEAALFTAPARNEELPVEFRDGINGDELWLPQARQCVLLWTIPTS